MRAHVAALLPVLAAGCGGPVTFVDERPIGVKATPAPEPEPPERVVVKADRIEINEKILFDVDKATIKQESYGLLAEIASVIKRNPHIKKISIEGHTDSDGSDRYNQSLSERRAAAVKAHLVSQGVSEQMLSSKGFGESRPIADNSSPEGKEKNRRVEFLITDQEEITKVYEVDRRTGQRREVSEAAQ